MLVLSRKLNEAIVIDGNIRIVVTSIHGNQVRLGIEAPDEVFVLREELCASARPCDNESSLRTRPNRSDLADQPTSRCAVSSA